MMTMTAICKHSSVVKPSYRKAVVVSYGMYDVVTYQPYAEPLAVARTLRYQLSRRGRRSDEDLGAMASTMLTTADHASCPA